VIEQIPAALAGERLDRIVALVTGLSRSESTALIAQGVVSLDGAVVTSGKFRVRAEQTLTIDGDPEPRPDTIPEADPSVPLTEVFVDDDVIVIDKAEGLVVHPGAGIEDGTVVSGVLARYPEVATVGDPTRPGIVHRLDRGTSGLMVVGRGRPADTARGGPRATPPARRRDQGVACGAFESSTGLIDAPLGRSDRDRTRMAVRAEGREARTRFEVREAFVKPVLAALVMCQLETGRTHQIRVHLAAIGHPVLGDSRYGGSRAMMPLARPMLHATELTFVHPGSGETMRFHVEPPADMAEVIDRLRAESANPDPD